MIKKTAKWCNNELDYLSSSTNSTDSSTRNGTQCILLMMKYHVKWLLSNELYKTLNRTWQTYWECIVF